MKEEKLKDLASLFEAVLRTSRKLEDSYNQLKKKFEILEGKLERNRRYLENILKSIDSGVCAVTLDGLITTFNRKATQVFGVKEDEVKGKHFGEIFAIDELKSADAKRIVEFFKGGRKIEFELGGERRILDISASLVVEEEKESGAVVVFSDITQVEKLKEESAKREKLAIIGQMAASIAHDIKNPLASIELLVPLLDDGSKREIVDNIMVSIKRINNIINNTLLFTRTVSYTPEKIFSQELAREIKLEIFTQIRELEYVEDVESFEFVSDRNLLKSALVNIISNALDAAKSRVVFRAFRRDKVVFEVIDDGEGIEDINKIFEPFFTKKKNGTGLGLAIVKEAVDIINGKVEVETSIKGTLFRIIL